MAEKDTTERILLEINDVFADIINTLLFQGNEIVSPNQLQEYSERSAYKADGKFHDLERDVIKSYNSSQNIRIACLGIENQSSPDKDMPLRVIGYDGAEYRIQLKGKERYPIVTIVLYFGTRPWNYPKNLLGCIQVPDKFLPYVNDYKLNLYEISFLSDDTVNTFQSDFGVVADYFVQKRRKKQYNPPQKTLKHVQEVLQLLHIFTGDYRFEEMYNKNYFKGKENVSMCNIVDQIEQNGIEKGIEKATKETILAMQSLNRPLSEISIVTKWEESKILEFLSTIQNKA